MPWEGLDHGGSCHGLPRAPLGAAGCVGGCPFSPETWALEGVQEPAHRLQLPPPPSLARVAQKWGHLCSTTASPGPHGCLCQGHCHAEAQPCQNNPWGGRVSPAAVWSLAQHVSSVIAGLRRAGAARSHSFLSGSVQSWYETNNFCNMFCFPSLLLKSK